MMAARRQAPTLAEIGIDRALVVRCMRSSASIFVLTSVFCAVANGCGSSKTTAVPEVGSPYAGHWMFVFTGGIFNSSSGAQEITVNQDGTIADTFHAFVIENGSEIYMTGTIEDDGTRFSGAL